MKTIILTLLLISLTSCTKQRITNKQIPTVPLNIVNEDYSIPYYLRDKFHYHKDLNTVFINKAKLGC